MYYYYYYYLNILFDTYIIYTCVRLSDTIKLKTGFGGRETEPKRSTVCICLNGSVCWADV